MMKSWKTVGIVDISKLSSIKIYLEFLMLKVILKGFSTRVLGNLITVILNISINLVIKYFVNTSSLC